MRDDVVWSGVEWGGVVWCEGNKQEILFGDGWMDGRMGGWRSGRSRCLTYKWPVAAPRVLVKVCVDKVLVVRE